MPHKVTRQRGHVPETQTLPGLLGQPCFAKRNKAACGIRGMELLSLTARAGAVWEGIVLPWLCTWAGFGSTPRYKGLTWGSDLALCFAEPEELGRVILWICERNLCPVQCHLEQGDHSLWMLPAGERCEEKAWLVCSKVGFDLESKTLGKLSWG